MPTIILCGGASGVRHARFTISTLTSGKPDRMRGSVLCINVSYIMYVYIYYNVYNIGINNIYVCVSYNIYCKSILFYVLLSEVTVRVQVVCQYYDMGNRNNDKNNNAWIWLQPHAPI